MNLPIGWAPFVHLATEHPEFNQPATDPCEHGITGPCSRCQPAALVPADPACIYAVCKRDGRCIYPKGGRCEMIPQPPMHPAAAPETEPERCYPVCDRMPCPECGYRKPAAPEPSVDISTARHEWGQWCTRHYLSMSCETAFKAGYEIGAANVRRLRSAESAEAQLAAVRALPRWAPCLAEPEEDDDGPLYQGWLTDPDGAWVKYEDILALLNAPSPGAGEKI